MPALKTWNLPAGILTISSHMVEDLRGRSYCEYRVEERNDSGAFVGYLAMGPIRSNIEVIATRIATQRNAA